MTQTMLIGKRQTIKLNKHNIKVIMPGKPIPYEEGSKKIRKLLKSLTL